MFDKVLDSDHFYQYVKYSVCEKANEILYMFCMKHPQIKHFYNKKLPPALIISRREAALVYCVRSYWQQKDPSLITWLTLPGKPAWNFSSFLILKVCIFQGFC